MNLKSQVLIRIGALLISVFSTISFSYSQDTLFKDYPIIGKPCPDFVLKAFHNNNYKSISLSDLKGKPFILDFWGEACIACIRSFPIVDSIAKKYRERMNVILVGLESKRIRPIYELNRKKYNLELVASYDKNLFKQFKGFVLPYTIWVDEKGIVKAVSGGFPKNDTTLVDNFLNNKKLRLVDYSYNTRLIRENYGKTEANSVNIRANSEATDSTVLFRSILARQTKEMPRWSTFKIDGKLRKGIPIYETYLIGVPHLYSVAYLGDVFTMFNEANGVTGQILYLTKDSLNLKLQDRLGGYHYSLRIPNENASKQKLMEAMQRDLKTYFGYNVSVEDQFLDRYFLVAKDSSAQSIKSTHKTRVLKSDAMVLDAEAVQLKSILTSIAAYAQKDRYIFNGTELKESDLVDIRMEGDLTDINEVRRLLNKYGLDLQMRKVMFKTLVIRDSE